MSRTPALPARPATGATRVVPLPPAARVVLRLRDAEARPAAVAAGFDLSGPINSVRGDAGRFACRLGPDEWLLVAPDGEAAAVEAGLAADLAGRFFAAVDVGHRNTALSVEGPHAREVLNGGVALDLADAAFPEGSATRTTCGKAEIVLVRVAGAPGFRVECWRSFAPYVDAFLTEVAREFA
jgi:sarcosine oxidase, subunit gamma